MKPLKAGTALKIKIHRGFMVVDIKSRRKVKKKNRIKFFYIIDKYKFNDEAGISVTEKSVEITQSYLNSLYQNNKIDGEVQSLDVFLAKKMLDNKYKELKNESLWTVTIK
ncbi:MAG: hypothetical protein ACOCQD_02135 [archaeon]